MSDNQKASSNDTSSPPQQPATLSNSANNVAPGQESVQATGMAPYAPAYPQMMPGQVYGNMGGYNPAPFGGHGGYGAGYNPGVNNDGQQYHNVRRKGQIAKAIIFLIFAVVILIIFFTTKKRT